MYSPDTDLLFPPRSLPDLRDLRGKTWQNLVDGIIAAGPDSLEQMAFVLMMARMNNCVTCNADSYRAMTGCVSCAKQSIKRSHESDEGLVVVFKAAMKEAGQFIQKKTTQLRDPKEHMRNSKGKHVK